MGKTDLLAALSSSYYGSAKTYRDDYMTAACYKAIDFKHVCILETMVDGPSNANFVAKDQ